MARRSRVSSRRVLALCLVAVLASGCLGARGPTAAALDPVVIAEPAPPPLPGPAERAAEDLAALSLADRDELASELLPLIHHYATTPGGRSSGAIPIRPWNVS